MFGRSFKTIEFSVADIDILILGLAHPDFIGKPFCIYKVFELVIINIKHTPEFLIVQFSAQVKII